MGTDSANQRNQSRKRDRFENESTGVGLFDLSGGSTDQCCNAHSDYEKDKA